MLLKTLDVVGRLLPCCGAQCGISGDATRKLRPRRLLRQPRGWPNKEEFDRWTIACEPNVSERPRFGGVVCRLFRRWYRRGCVVGAAGADVTPRLPGLSSLVDLTGWPARRGVGAHVMGDCDGVADLQFVCGVVEHDAASAGRQED